MRGFRIIGNDPFVRLGAGVGLQAGGGAVYRPYDEFSDAHDAGAVDGTLATDGVHTRNAIDLSSKISIVDGKLVIAGGTGSENQTGTWYTPAITRESGFALRIDTVFPDVTSALLIGLHNTASASLSTDSNGLYCSTNLRASKSGVSAAVWPVLMTPVAGTAYTFWIVLRSAGKFIFGNIGGVYKLLWFDAWDSTSALYLGVASTNGKSTTDRFRRQVGRYYRVNALVSDSFNRADGAPGNTDGAGHLEANSGSGVAWTNRVGAAAIASNKLVITPDTIGIATVDAGYADVVLRCDTARSAGNFGLVVRYADADNYVYAYCDGTNVTLRKRALGVDSQVLAPVAVTYAADAKFMITADATKFRVYYNEILVQSEQTISNASLQTGTGVGVYTTDVGNTFDNLVAFRRSGYDDLEQS